MNRTHRLILLAAALALISVFVAGESSRLPAPPGALPALALGSSNTVDAGGNVGADSSVALDASGNPVIAYYDTTNTALKVVHCNDSACAGSNETFATPDSANDVGRYPSLVLDATGKPVVAYLDVTNDRLRVLHCGDVNCSSGNSIQTADGLAGYRPSLALASSGAPVIAYFDVTARQLKLATCADANCAGATALAIIGSDAWVDPVSVGPAPGPSLSLRSGDIPVLAYTRDLGTEPTAVYILCNNSACSSYTTRTVDTLSEGREVVFSLDLDSSGFPVAVFRNSMFSPTELIELNVSRCQDASCAARSIAVIHQGALDPVLWHNASLQADLRLDADDRPRVVYSHADWTSGGDTSVELRTVACWLKDCTETDVTNVEESVASYVLPGGPAGNWPEFALALNAAGSAGISYYDPSGADLEYFCCGPASPASSTTIVDSTGDVGFFTSLELDAGGIPVISYQDRGNRDLRLVRCGSTDCSSGNTYRTPDSTNDVGAYTSLVLRAGNPIVSYRYSTDADLRILVCDDATCAGDAGLTLEVGGGSGAGAYTSVSLDSFSQPMVAHYATGPDDLRMVFCESLSCVGPPANSFATPDSAGITGLYTSSLFRASDARVLVSYHDETNGDLKLLHCNAAFSCGAPNLVVLDATGAVGVDTSLRINSSNYPVISYYDVTNGNLKLVRCSDEYCAAMVIRTVDAPDDVGRDTALALTSTDRPVISYYDATHGDLKLTICEDEWCGTGNVTRTLDAAGDVGRFTSIQLDNDRPVISYYDVTNGDLKLIRCVDLYCSDVEGPDTSLDSDGDGCTDVEEGGDTPTLGGLRNPLFQYDFYDVNGSKKVDSIDIAQVRAKFNTEPPDPNYAATHDRSPGLYPWAPGAPNGVINAVDIGLVRASFNHSCQAAP